MSDVAQDRCRRGQRLAVALLLSAGLVACGRAGHVEVTAAAPVASAPRPVAASTFQGQVADVDRGAGTMVVAVRIVWMPVLEARAHERVVVVDPATGWDPAPGGLSELGVGQEVQVEADDLPDGRWQAVNVLLLDID